MGSFGITRRSAIATGFASSVTTRHAAATERTLLNVSYDPTGELYREIDPAFIALWQRQTSDHLAINQSLGGSAALARRPGRSPGRCRDAGARRRDRRPRQSWSAREGLAETVAGQCLPIYQCDRVSGAQGQPKAYPGLD